MGTRTSKYCDQNNEHDATVVLVFALGAEAFEMDLCEQDAKKVSDSFGKLTKMSRQIPLKDMVKRVSENGHAEFDPALVREWAAANGKQFSPKGRLSAELVAEYQAAQQAE